VSTQQRQTVIVTGGNSGIGYECAKAIARSGRSVLIAARNRDASRAAIAGIEHEAGPGAATEIPLDLGSLESVRAFVRRVDTEGIQPTAIVCNAGVQFFNGPKLSTEGHELSFAVNHLGHFLLVNLLLRRLAETASPRVVVVASGVHDPARRTGMPKPSVGALETLAATGGDDPKTFNGRLAYVNSKLCNLWFTYELDRRLRSSSTPGALGKVTANGYDPGLVPGSNLGRDYPPALRFVWNRVLPGLARLLSPLLPSINPAPKSGAALARLVTDPMLEGVSGKYFPSHSRWSASPSSDFSYDTDRASALWAFSTRLVGLDSSDSPLATIDR
jgi:light-dependent protochlorophyllide reductase